MSDFGRFTAGPTQCCILVHNYNQKKPVWEDNTLYANLASSRQGQVVGCISNVIGLIEYWTLKYVFELSIINQFSQDAKSI